MINTQYSNEFLTALEQMELKESYLRLEVLNWDEELIQEISGIVTGGSMSFDGKSSMRRTCNFTMLLDDTAIPQYQLEEIIGLNKKFRLYIGYKNRLVNYQKQYGEKVWFKLGTFVFITASFSHSTSESSISVTARDKMCLLNGSVQGTLPASIVLHEKSIGFYYEYGGILSKTFATSAECAAYKPSGARPQSYSDSLDDYEVISFQQADGSYVYLYKATSTLVPIFNIIYELVNHWGNEPIQNIFINDIPDYGKMVMKYNGTKPLYLLKSNEAFNGNYTFTEPTSGEYKKFVAGQVVGYKLTELTYPGDLISNIGESITSILDKIVSMLGNFEYFYDIDGRFVFQEQKNYLNTSYVPLQELTDNNYVADFSKKDVVYSFKGTKLISSYSNAPKWDNIKNDFVVWGTRKTASGAEIPIRYHLAIDNPPAPNSKQKNIDYREILYQNDNNSVSTASYYQMEMNTKYDLDYDNIEETSEWRRLYSISQNPDGSYNGDWTDQVKNDPENLNYFLEFIDGSGDFAKYSISNIGRRTYAVNDKDASCIYFDNPSTLIFVDSQEEGKYYQNNYGYTYCVTSKELSSALGVSSQGKSCFEVIRDAFYQKVSLQETITLNSLPIYYLEPGDMIEVEDDKSRIYGKYMLQSLSIPFTYNGMMSMNAVRAEKRI